MRLRTRIQTRLPRRRLRAALFLLLLAGLLLFRLRYIPTVRRLVKMQVDNRTSDLINRAIDAYLDREQITYEDLVRLEKSETGAITAMQLDMNTANRLRSAVLEEIDRRIPDMNREKVQVPLGNLLFPGLLSGQGGDLPVRVVALRSSNADLESRFTQAGINQTLHRLELTVSVELLVLSPAGFTSLRVETRVPVAQTVIVGTVPNTLITTGD